MTRGRQRPGRTVAHHSSRAVEASEKRTSPRQLSARIQPLPSNPLVTDMTRAEWTRIKATNPWLRCMRWDRELALDAWGAQEAVNRRRHPQAVPTARALTHWEAAGLGFVVGLVAWLAWGLAPVAPAVVAGAGR